MSKKQLLLGTVAVVLFAAILASSLYVKKALPQQVVAVEKIRVITGSEFDISLINGKRIHGVLETYAPTGQGEEVSKAVEDLINHSENPRVKLLSKDREVWKIEMYLKVDGKNVVLSDWLKNNQMTWK
jgi:hypothetical protein